MNFSPETIEAARLFVSAVQTGDEQDILALWRFSEDVQGIDPRELDALQIAALRPYYIGPSRYSKSILVRCPSPDGYKTRASRLLGDGLNCRWTNRERGFLASPSKVKRFEELYAAGWDACAITGKLRPPEPPLAPPVTSRPLTPGLA